MSVEDKNLRRIATATKADLPTELSERMIGMDIATGYLGAKTPASNMFYYCPEEGDALFNSVVVNKITPTADNELASKKYVDDNIGTVSIAGTDGQVIFSNGDGTAEGRDNIVSDINGLHLAFDNTRNIILEANGAITGETVLITTDNSNNALVLTNTTDALDHTLSISQAGEVLTNTSIEDIQGGADRQITTKEYVLDLIAEGIMPSQLSDGNGVVTGMAISIGSPTSTFSVSSGTYNKIGVGILDYVGVTNQTVTNIATQEQTYIAIDTATGLVVQQATKFTPEQRRTNVILGVLIHTNNVIINAVNNLPDVAVHSLAQLNDFMSELGNFNINGNVISANGANLSINKSEGQLYKKGINFATNPNDPHTKDMASLIAPSTLRMRMSNGVEGSNTAVLNLQYESSVGVLTTIPSNSFGVFRVVMFASNLIRIQYPQFIYSTIAEAQDGISNEAYITESNMAENGLLRGYIIVRGATTALNDTARAKFIQADRFGQMPFGGSGGGLTTLQGAYDNSIEPEIITNSTLGAVSLQRGSTADTDNVLEIKNGAGVVQLYAKGDGENNFYPYADVKDPTGFTDSANITVTYNSTNRTVTLTGTVKALWRGKVVPVLVSGWVSDPHSATLDQNYFLYYNGSTFVWSTTPWTFDMLQIAEVYYKSTNKFAVKEVHGFMDYATHQECHYNIGTWKKSGGAFSSFTLNSTTVANRRPVLGASVIVDEDIETTNASVSTGQYTRFNLTGATGTPVTALDQADFLSTGAGGRFNYNLFTGGAWTIAESANNEYAKFFVLNIPVTADSGSQKFRTLYLMAQSASTSLSTIQAISPASYNWGVLAGAGVSEFVYVGEIIVQSTTNNWQLISVNVIAGNKISQTIIPSVTTPNLSQVLVAGADATDLDINNLDNLDVRTIAVNDPASITAQVEIKATTTVSGGITVTGTEAGTGPAGVGTADGTYTYTGATIGQMTNVYQRGTDAVYIGQVVAIWVITNNINPAVWTDAEYYLNNLSPIGTYTPIAGSGNVATPTVAQGGSVVGSTAIHTNGDIEADGYGKFGRLEVDGKIGVTYSDTDDRAIIDTNGNGIFAYEFRQQAVPKLTIHKDGSASLPDCVDDDITLHDDIMTLSKSFQIAGRYRSTAQNSNATLTLNKNDNGKLFEITSTSATITLTLDPAVITESWFDFSITDLTVPIKQITLISGTQTISIPAVAGAFRVYKWGENDTRLIKYTGTGSAGAEGIAGIVNASDGSGGWNETPMKYDSDNQNMYMSTMTKDDLYDSFFDDILLNGEMISARELSTKPYKTTIPAGTQYYRITPLPVSNATQVITGDVYIYVPGDSGYTARSLRKFHFKVMNPIGTGYGSEIQELYYYDKLSKPAMWSFEVCQFTDAGGRWLGIKCFNESNALTGFIIKNTYTSEVSITPSSGTVSDVIVYDESYYIGNGAGAGVANVKTEAEFKSALNNPLVGIINVVKYMNLTAGSYPVNIDSSTGWQSKLVIGETLNFATNGGTYTFQAADEGIVFVDLKFYNNLYNSAGWTTNIVTNGGAGNTLIQWWCRNIGNGTFSVNTNNVTSGFRYEKTTGTVTGTVGNYVLQQYWDNTNSSTGGSSALTYQFGFAVSGQYIGTSTKFIPASVATDLTWTDLSTTDKFRASVIDAGNLTKWSYAIRETTHDSTIAQAVTIKCYKNGTEVATVTIAQGASTKGVYTLGTPQAFSAGDEMSFSIVSNATGVTLDGVTIVAKVG